MTDHQYLIFEVPPKERKTLREVALELMNFYTQKMLSRKKWQKINPQIVNCWQGDKSWQSKPVSLFLFENYLEKNNSFDFKHFDLIDPLTYWMDSSISISLSSNFMKIASPFPVTLSNNLPIRPTIDREGYIYTSMQLTIQKNIKRIVSYLVANSYNYLSVEWFDYLRFYFSECVSLIDITLNQLYIKAEYEPFPSWKFDRDYLGPRINRRMSDKIDWVFKITGNALDDAYEEKQALNRIKAVRNHIQHFDPPCFGYTLEDVSEWLNESKMIARLAWKIRKRIGASLTQPLIELLLLPDVKFVPKDQNRIRKKQEDDVGYKSTCWVEGVIKK